jgi:hypothetical protein
MQYAQMFQDVTQVLSILRTIMPHTATKGHDTLVARKGEKKKQTAERSLLEFDRATSTANIILRRRESLRNSIMTDMDLRSRDSGQQRDTIRGKITFNHQITLAALVGVSFKCSDDLIGSTSLAEFGKIFRYYRYNRLTIRLPAPIWSTADIISLVGFPAGTNVVVVPLWINCEGENFLTVSDNTDITSEFVMPRGTLNPQHEWFLTTGDGIEPNADVQCQVIFTPKVSSVEVINITVTVDYEFCCLLESDIIGAYFEDKKTQKVPRKGPSFSLLRAGLALTGK